MSSLFEGMEDLSGSLGSVYHESIVEHRASCHRCGNMRKSVYKCTECPHIWCRKCVDKLVEEDGSIAFSNGCPVCKNICCCGSKKSQFCDRQYHCYKKCLKSKMSPKSQSSRTSSFHDVGDIVFFTPTPPSSDSRSFTPQSRHRTASAAASASSTGAAMSVSSPFDDFIVGFSDADDPQAAAAVAEASEALMRETAECEAHGGSSANNHCSGNSMFVQECRPLSASAHNYFFPPVYGSGLETDPERSTAMDVAENAILEEVNANAHVTSITAVPPNSTSSVGALKPPFRLAPINTSLDFLNVLKTHTSPQSMRSASGRKTPRNESAASMLLSGGGSGDDDAVPMSPPKRVRISSESSVGNTCSTTGTTTFTSGSNNALNSITDSQHYEGAAGSNAAPGPLPPPSVIGAALGFQPEHPLPNSNKSALSPLYLSGRRAAAAAAMASASNALPQQKLNLAAGNAKSTMPQHQVHSFGSLPDAEMSAAQKDTAGVPATTAGAAEMHVQPPFNTGIPSVFTPYGLTLETNPFFVQWPGAAPLHMTPLPSIDTLLHSEAANPLLRTMPLTISESLRKIAAHRATVKEQHSAQRGAGSGEGTTSCESLVSTYGMTLHDTVKLDREGEASQEQQQSQPDTLMSDAYYNKKLSAEEESQLMQDINLLTKKTISTPAIDRAVAYLNARSESTTQHPAEDADATTVLQEYPHQHDSCDTSHITFTTATTRTTTQQQPRRMLTRQEEAELKASSGGNNGVNGSNGNGNHKEQYQNCAPNKPWKRSTSAKTNTGKNNTNTSAAVTRSAKRGGKTSTDSKADTVITKDMFKTPRAAYGVVSQENASQPTNNYLWTDCSISSLHNWGVGEHSLSPSSLPQCTPMTVIPSDKQHAAEKRRGQHNVTNNGMRGATAGVPPGSEFDLSLLFSPKASAGQVYRDIQHGTGDTTDRNIKDAAAGSGASVAVKGEKDTRTPLQASGQAHDEAASDNANAGSGHSSTSDLTPLGEHADDLHFFFDPVEFCSNGGGPAVTGATAPSAGVVSASHNGSALAIKTEYPKQPQQVDLQSATGAAPPQYFNPVTPIWAAATPRTGTALHP